MDTDLDDGLLGRTLGGRFRVDRALKRGGMGAVYRGHDLQADVDVAIKVVKQTLADDKEAIARFKREIRLMAEVQDPRVVRAIDTGDEGGVLWIAMELLEGPSLRERLDSRGRWPWADTLPVVRDIALALGAAHARGVIHRDLKPENVMLVDGGPGQAPAVKLLDFGIAKQSHGTDAAATHMTGTGLLVGTPGYVAPEVVLEGTTDDPRSDFYAVGVTWFEMLTGQKPFSAKTPMALALRHAHEMPPTPSSLLPFAPVPGPVERLVMQLLAKDPAARPADAGQLALFIDDLHAAAEQAATPMPSLLPHERTVTDVIGGTGVVPFSATPRPASSSGASPSGASPPSSSSSSSSSPAPTAMTPMPVGQDLVMPPSPSPLAPAGGLTRRQWFAGGLVVAILVVGGTAVKLRPGRRARSTVEVTAASQAAPAPTTVTMPVVDPRVAPVVIPAVPVVAPVVAPVAPTPLTPPKPPSPPRPVRPPPAIVDREPAPPPPMPLRTSERGTIFIQPMPKDYGWRVSVDGMTPLETPFVHADFVGEHTLVFTSPRSKERFVRQITLRAGQNPPFRERLGQP